MSYILDALRKAEADRARGGVPGLHAQPTGPAPSEAGRRAWSRAAVPWVLAAVALALATALGWRQITSEQGAGAVSAPVASAGPVAPTSAVTAASLPPPTSTESAPGGGAMSTPALGTGTGTGTEPSTAPVLGATTGHQPAVGPAPTTARSTARADTPRTTPAPTSAAAQTLAASPSPSPSPTAAPAAVAPVAATTAPNAAAPVESSADRRIYTVAELPEATRRDLPPLSIAGASYSDHPANRLLIINGNVAHEGDHLAPDLVLEHIDLKSAVLRFRGVHVGVSY